MTQIALATMVGRSSSTVSKWEKGDQVPESDALDRLAERLAMPVSWFLSTVPNYGQQVCFYRSTASVTKEAQTIAHIRLKWLNEISLTLQGWLDWPAVNIPTLGQNDHRSIADSDIERAAQECRRQWKLGFGPISDVVLVLENAGVICVREELGFTRMDGASQWFATDGRPYVFLSADKANGVRSRFDAAHELGHLVLHRDVSDLEFQKRYPELERQAHLFAGAFLMPAETFASELIRPNLDTFVALKARWKVSIGAMIMRCKQLEIIDEDYATRLWKNYSARGWRKGEPLDERIGFEEVRLLPRAITLLLSEGGLTKESLLASLGIGAGDCERLCGLSEGFFEQQSSVSQLTPIKLRPGSDAATGEIGREGNVLAFPARAQKA